MSFKEILVIMVVAVSVFMINLDVSITNIAMPTLNSYFKVGTGDTAKIVLSYLLSLSGFLLIFGRLSDEYGSKNIFIPGILIFMISSVFCALSQTLLALIASRFFQGVGGAMIASTYGAVVVNYLSSGISGRAFGLITAAGGAGFALGAPIGGYIIEKSNWHWIFMINVPVCIVTFLAALYILRNEKTVIDSAAPDPAVVNSGGSAAGLMDGPAINVNTDDSAIKKRENVGFDYPGAVYCFVFLAAFIYALNQGKIDGWTAWPVLASYIVAAVFLPLFIWRENNASEPMLDFAVLFDKRLAGCYLATILVIMCLDGMSFFFPLFFEKVKDMSPASTGKLLMVFPVLSLFLSPFAGYLSDRKGPGVIVRYSLFLLTVSGAMFCLYSSMVDFVIIISALLVFGSGLALFFPSATALVMSHAPEGREGIATAIYSSVTNIGSILGIAVFEWLFSISNGAGAAARVIDTAGVAAGFRAVAVLSFFLCVAGFIAVMNSCSKKEGASCAAVEI